MDGIVEKFDTSAHHGMVPMARLVSLRDNLKQAGEQANGLVREFSKVVQSHGGLRSFNYDNLHALTGNGQQHSLQGHFQNVENGIESALEAFYQVLIILRPTKANYSFQAAANAFSGLLGQVQDTYAEASNEHASIVKMSEDIAKSKAEIEEIGQNLNQRRDQGAEDQAALANLLTEATQKSEAINNVHAEATSLETSVQEYQDKFDKFDRQIDVREKAFETGSANQKSLFEKFNEQQTSVDELIERSEQMLKGATVAGLASRFEEIRTELTDELKSARRTFYWGIGFLFITALPLMAFVFLPILGPLMEVAFPEITGIATAYGAKATITGWQYLGEVLARFIILLPAAWFVSFTAIRHASLFRLREHYSYKYSMAVSVEGFKKQAEGYESEIAALVLEQLAFNPADKLVPSKHVKEGKVPNPVMEFVLRKLRQKFDSTSEAD